MESYLENKYTEEELNVLKSPPDFSTIRINTLKISVADGLEHLRSLYSHLEVFLHDRVPDVACVRSVGPVDREVQSKCVYVDYKCGEAVLRGSHIYSPGILASNHSCN